jgi:integrase
LVLDDVTPDGLVVRQTKFRKSRWVPVHTTTAVVLDRYLERRQTVADGDVHVFLSPHGHALTYAMVNGTFHFLLRFVELRSIPGQRPPRIHDLRHRFAVRALEHCPGDRDRVARHMLALSTYLGHAHVADTYWYLPATPHLMTDIADACAGLFSGGMP